METKIMKQLNIEYDNDNDKINGCIARLAGRRKNDKVFKNYYIISIISRHLLSNISFCFKVKNIIDRGKKKHQNKLSKQRTKEEMSKDKVKKPKVQGAFSIDGIWYNQDGSDYNVLGKLRSEMTCKMKSEDDMKDELETMSTELAIYREKVYEMKTSDKKVIIIHSI